MVPGGQGRDLDRHGWRSFRPDMIALHLADLGIPFTPLWPPELSERCAELSKRLADAASSIEGEARLDAARGFARYLGASDPAAEIPRHGLLAARPNRHHPYIFTGQEIAALLNEAGQHSWHLPAVTYPALFGLIAVTGCRLGEAVRLEDADVDLDETMITIRDSKYGKFRRIPVDATVTAALQDYLGRRRSLRPAPKAPTLFLSAYGTRLITRTTSPPRRSSPRWPTARTSSTSSPPALRSARSRQTDPRRLTPAEPYSHPYMLTADDAFMNAYPAPAQETRR